MAIKLTHEYVKNQMKNVNYILLSKEYKNANTKLEFKCDLGHKYKTKWAVFQRGHRCPICFQENNRGKNHSNWKNYSESHINKFNGYKDKVEQLSNQNFHEYYYIINPNRLSRSKYENHLDHIYTIIDGFKNNVPSEVIASPINLQMLTAFENNNKNRRSDMSLGILYSLYYQFEKEVNNG